MSGRQALIVVVRQIVSSCVAHIHKAPFRWRLGLGRVGGGGRGRLPAMVVIMAVYHVVLRRRAVVAIIFVVMHV